VGGRGKGGGWEILYQQRGKVRGDSKVMRRGMTAVNDPAFAGFVVLSFWGSVHVWKTTDAGQGTRGKKIVRVFYKPIRQWLGGDRQIS